VPIEDKEPKVLTIDPVVTRIEEEKDEEENRSGCNEDRGRRIE